MLVAVNPDPINAATEAPLDAVVERVIGIVIQVLFVTGVYSPMADLP